MSMFIFSILFVPFLFGSILTAELDVSNLQVEPDYRSIRLKWNYKDQEGLIGFQVRYCELAVWHTKTKCRKQNIDLKTTDKGGKSLVNGDDAVVQMFTFPEHRYEASISNLRMLTNYSVLVKANYGQLSERPSDLALHKISKDALSRNTIIVETKSFSAKTSRCLANSSEIEVFTGPFFSGKISVEGSNNPLCFIYGDRKSPQSVYTFVINYNLCGSKMTNNSRIETMVIVHENKEILTHNSRRYFVVCTFNSEIQTITASVAVPKHLLKKFFDRIKEKERIASDNPAKRLSLEGKDNNSTRVERFFQKRNSLSRPIEIVTAKMSHLRNSRMLAEDAKAKLVVTNRNEIEISLKTKIAVASSSLALATLVIFFYLLYTKHNSNLTVG